MRDPTPRIFAIDLRSLAALRIGLGALLLADLAYRALDLEAHYADTGVLPRAALRAVLRDPAGLWSLHALSGAAAAQWALFGLAALAAAALLVGYRARWAAAASWLLLISVHHRNPLILTAADQVLRLLLFWSLFVPLDARWAARRRAVSGDVVCTPASAALLLQVALVYAMSVLFKLRAEEWTGLTALQRAFAVEGVATGWARWLTQFPELLAAGAAATLAIEALAVVLPFVPWRTGALRIAIALAAIGLHVLGVGTTMRLGLMPAVMALAWVPFVPGVFWGWLGFRARGAGEPAPATRRLAAAGALAAIAFALVVAENAASLVSARGASGLPRAVSTAVEALGLSQQWRLWDRPIANRYYVFAATLRDGSQVDLHTGAPLDWDRPRRRSANNHWWKYHLHLARRYAAALRPWYARHLAARWNRDRPAARHVARLELMRIHAGGRAKRRAEMPREVLWRGEPPA